MYVYIIKRIMTITLIKPPQSTFLALASSSEKPFNKLFESPQQLRKQRGVALQCLLVRLLTSSCCSGINSTRLWVYSRQLPVQWCVGTVENVFLFFISCHRHYRWPHVAMATEPHPAGNPRAHHPNTTSQAHTSLRILRHRYVWKVRTLCTATHFCRGELVINCVWMCSIWTWLMDLFCL